MKTHIVREAFSLDGKDYPRGTEISDPAVLEAVCKSHRGHMVQQHHDVPAPAAEAKTK